MNSPAIRLLAKFALNVLLVFVLANYMDQYFVVSGGLGAYIIIGALITLMNIIVRPILNVITLPLKLFATIFAIILVNGVFLWLIYQISLIMDPNVLTITVGGGIGGWIVLSLVFGIANWLMRLMTK